MNTRYVLRWVMVGGVACQVLVPHHEEDPREQARFSLSLPPGLRHPDDMPESDHPTNSAQPIKPVVSIATGIHHGVGIALGVPHAVSVGTGV